MMVTVMMVVVVRAIEMVDKDSNSDSAICGGGGDSDRDGR